MNTLEPLRPNEAKQGKYDHLTVNEVDNLRAFEKEFTEYISVVNPEAELSQKQLAFLIKFPHFGMKLIYKVSCY